MPLSVIGEAGTLTLQCITKKGIDGVVTGEAEGEQGGDRGGGDCARGPPQPPPAPERPRRQAVQLPAHAAAIRAVCAHMH